jgi:hypothetical protein
MTAALGTVVRRVAVSPVSPLGFGFDMVTVQMPIGRGETADPKNWDEPNVKMPPSEATNRYPESDVFVSMPTTGLASWMLPVDPRNGALNEKMPPSPATSQ